MKKFACAAFAGVAALSAGVAFAANGVWKNTTLGSAEAPLDYSLEGNWEEGAVASGVGATADFSIATSGKRFVRIPEGLTLGKAVGYGGSESTTILVGGQLLTLQMATSGSNSQGSLNYKTYGTVCTLPYAALIDAPRGLDLCCCSVAGDVRIGAQFFRGTGGNNAIRLDYYANAVGGARTNAVYGATDAVAWEWVVSDGSLDYYAPRASATALVGTWSQTDGSAILTPVGTPNTVCVGTSVTGAGILPGTFVRRVYKPSNVIELSQPVEGTLSENSVTFAPQRVACLQYVPVLRRQGSNAINFNVNKYGEADDVVFEVGSLVGGVAKGTTFSSSTAYYSTLVVHDGYGFTQPITFAKMNVVFAEAADPTHQGLPRAKMSIAASTSPSVTVESGLTAAIGTLVNVVGTMKKRGGGVLSAALDSATESAGTIRVEEGTFQLTETVGGEPATVESVFVAAGAKLVLPPEGLKVGTLVAEDGAEIAGAAKIWILKPADSSFSGVTLSGGASLGLVPSSGSAPVLSVPEAEVVGHPAFWVDASKLASLTYDESTKEVTRWNDCRAGETTFASNIVLKPKLVVDANGAGQYVKLTRTNAYVLQETETLVWSRGFTGVQAVFLVQDPADGGGIILGRTEERFPAATYGFTQGGPFYRAQANATGVPLVNSAYSAKNVREGRFYMNGEAWSGTTRGYPGPGYVVVESHPTSGTVADAFGCGYTSGIKDGAGLNGGMRIAECIVYTNALTYAERLKVAQYLSRKWRGCDIVYDEMPDGEPGLKTIAGGNDVSLAVEDGGTAEIEGIGIGGTFTKTGAGTLYVDSVTRGALRIEEGDAVIRSMSFTKADVPSDGTWCHFDASDTNTMTFSVVNGTNFVTKVLDVNGNGVSLQPSNRPKTENKAYPWLRMNGSPTGLPLYDLGPLTHADGAWANPNPQRTPDFVSATGNHFSNDNYNGSAAPKLKSCFIMYGSEYGGNSLLGSRGNSHFGYGFSHAQSADNSTPIWNGTSSQIASVYNNRAGLYTTLNGERFNPFATPFSLGFDVFAYGSDCYPRQTQSLAIAGYDNDVNGLLYGEIILYTRYVGAAVSRWIEAYLMKKWLGRDLPGYAKATPDALIVAEGSTVTVSGAGVIATKAIGGGGTVNGKVVLTANAKIVAKVTADGLAIGQMALSDELDLSLGGTVTLDGDANKVTPGDYVLVSSASETTGAWTLDNSFTACSRRVFSLTVQPGKIVLHVMKRGTLIRVR